jgi:isopenicillin N synthase-like dioxygenase
MATTKYTDRSIPKISLHDFPTRIDEITQQLVHAAETDGFFGLINHGISLPEIEHMFSTSESFFSLPDKTKATVPFSHLNAGWEKNAQIRPSTGQPDQKESYQMQFGANMNGLWLPEDTLPGFKDTSLEFMHKAQSVSEKLMICFARGLGFEDDYFVKAHDVSRPESQTVLRLLHYFEVDKNLPVPEGYYRAGAHVDWDFVTLLFQRAGQSGLEICPGREVSTGFGIGDTWTKVEPAPGEIVCNIGDLLSEHTSVLGYPFMGLEFLGGS